MPYGSPDDATGEGLCKDWPAFQFDAGGQIRVVTTLRLPGLQDFQGAVIELGAAAASGGGQMFEGRVIERGLWCQHAVGVADLPGVIDHEIIPLPVFQKKSSGEEKAVAICA